MKRIEIFPGSGVTEMVLDEAEQNTLTKAADILAKLVEVSDDNQGEFATDMALASYICRELADGWLTQTTTDA